jgi:hypothetical protein
MEESLARRQADGRIFPTIVLWSARINVHAVLGNQAEELKWI